MVYGSRRCDLWLLDSIFVSHNFFILLYLLGKYYSKTSDTHYQVIVDLTLFHVTSKFVVFWLICSCSNAMVWHGHRRHTNKTDLL
jgi:hypothetical protein